MYNICVFAGTTEGRELVQFLQEQPVSVTACVATEYGEAMLHPAETVTVSAARLTVREMTELFEKQKFDLVIDATHPYAFVVTENIVQACRETKTEYLRLLRENKDIPDDAVFVSDITEAVQYLNLFDGNILLTTGSKELSLYADIRDFKQRVYARVLPMEDSLHLCQQAGLAPSHILAMQGPFSEEMNTAMLRAVSARYMVTKQSGTKGGFDQKIAAARQAGAELIVIGRPPQRRGKSFAQVVAELCERFDLSVHPKVAVVGIGPGSRQAMTAEVLEAIASADCVIGAKRMTEAAAEQAHGCYHAIAPEDISRFIHRSTEFHRFAVLMSGDIGFYSGAKKLLPLLEDCEVRLLPGISSLAYLCARLGTSYEDVLTVSLHGREYPIVRDVRMHRRMFVLVGGDNGMRDLCRKLCQAGLGHVQMYVGERLSYADETITAGTAEELCSHTFDSLSAVLIENDRAGEIVTHGLPDRCFQRSEGTDAVVPMTKSEVRSVCLSKLQLRRDSVCWDIGAGTGSVAIEMAMQCKTGAVYAVERKASALKLLRDNRSAFAAEQMEIVAGTAPAVCASLPAPTHVFIGGSSGNMREIISYILERNPEARIVATAIALETVAELTACMKDFPFTETEVVSLSAARDRTAGKYHLMTAQNPVYIFTMQAGGEHL